jgi:nicotinate-nucleotide adenylyltransferase
VAYRIALFGGSFNPPHEGHLHISRCARPLLGADEVRWLVTPRNPHKPEGMFLPYDERVAACKRIAQGDDFIAVSEQERFYRTRTTFDTMTALRKKEPHTRFVWIIGSDYVDGFHRWHRWEELLHMIPFAVFTRGDYPLHGNDSPALRRYRRYVYEDGARLLFRRNPPAIQLVDVPPHPASSTALRLGNPG